MTNMIESKSRISSLGNILLIFLISFLYGDLRSPRALFFGAKLRQISRKFRQNSVVSGTKQFREIEQLDKKSLV